MPNAPLGVPTLLSLNPLAAQNPNVVKEYLTAQRQQQLAQALMQQGMAPIDYDPRGRISWAQGLAKMLQTGLGAWTGSNAIDSTAQAMSDANQAIASRFPSGSPSSPQGDTSAPSPGPSTAQMALALGAQQGSVGPTNTNASLMDQIAAPQPTSNSPPTTRAGNPTGMAPPLTSGPTYSPPAAAPAPSSASGSSLAMPGMTPQQSIAAYMADPAGYMTELMKRSDNRTELTKTLLSAGIDPSSPQGQQILQQSLRKSTYIAPENARPGSWSIYADGRKVWNPAIPNGGVPAYDSNGNVIGTSPMPGAADVVQGQNRAETLGRTSGTLYDTVDPITGQGTKTLGSDFFGNGAPAVTAGRFSGYAAPGNPKPVTSLAPGSTDLASAGAKRFNDLQTSAQDSPMRVNVLDNVLNLSRQGVATGPTQDYRNKLLGLIGDSGLGQRVAQIAGADPQSDVARYQEITKFMKQNAVRSWQAAGGSGTDAQLDAQTEANVNKGMFPQAVQDVALWQKGSELALQAKARAAAQWKASGGSPINQDQFETQWRNQFDPRVYQMRAIAQFDPTRLNAFVSRLSPADRQSLLLKNQIATQNGWIQ